VDVGVGIVTVPERKEAFDVCVDSIGEHFDGLIYIYEDYAHEGVAVAKNQLLRWMMDAGLDLFILCEDDMEVLSPDAVSIYVDAIRPGRVEHLNFAYASCLNEGGPIGWNQDSLPLFPHVAGCWSVYTRNVIETVGYMDENLYNAWEHVDHTYRVSLAGLTTEFWRFVDAPDSDKALRVQSVPSVIGHNPENIKAGYDYLVKVGRVPPNVTA